MYYLCINKTDKQNEQDKFLPIRFRSELFRFLNSSHQIICDIRPDSLFVCEFVECNYILSILHYEGRTWDSQERLVCVCVYVQTLIRNGGGFVFGVENS